MRGRSPVLDAVLDARFDTALEIFAGISNPTMEDERWAAYSKFCLGQSLPARDQLLRLVIQGYAVSRIELATMYRLLGNTNRALDELEKLHLSEVCTFDRALALRERGACLVDLGRYVEAAIALEEAWLTAQYKEACELQAGVAYALGYVQSLLGHDGAAQHYLDISVRESVGAKKLYPLLARAYVNACQLRVQEAECDVNSAQALTTTLPNADGVMAYTTATLSYARGWLVEAGTLYEQAAIIARQRGDRSTQIFASLGAVAAFTAQGEYDRASLSIGQAYLLSITSREKAHIAWRKGVLLSRQNCGETNCLEHLEEAYLIFKSLGLWREMGGVLLHKAEILFSKDQMSEGADKVREAIQVCQALGQGANLSLELRTLPLCQAYLRKSLLPHNTILDSLKPTYSAIEIATLGSERVIVGGKPISFQLRRTFEVLVYLLRFPHVSFDNIHTNLFSNDYSGARGYFHQVRTELAKRVSGIQIAYDRLTKTYSVDIFTASFVWDVQQIYEELESEDDGFLKAMELYKGPFLRSIDSEWANSERETIGSKLLQKGVVAIENYYNEGKLDLVLSLSRRLLEINPYNIEITGIVLEMLSKMLGIRVTQVEAVRLSKIFLQDLGEVPDIVKFWSQHDNIKNIRH